MTLEELIVKMAEAGVKLQRADGSFPPGTNGPRRMKETPVKATAHWGMLLFAAKEINSDAKFQSGIEHCRDYLHSKKLRPHNKAYHCCINDRPVLTTNGLIGQSWAVEFLYTIGKYFGDEKSLSIAHNTILSHRFDNNTSLWNSVDLEGNPLGVHHPLNQQIWFSLQAHRIGNLYKDLQLVNSVENFIAKLPEIITLENRILANSVPLKTTHARSPYSTIREILKRIKKTKKRREFARGYHAFTLLGIALLRQETQRHFVWKEDDICKKIAISIDTLNNQIYNFSPNQFSFAYAYNPTGFEAAAVLNYLSEFTNSSKQLEVDWIKRQLNLHFDPTTYTMSRNTCDPNTLSARAYEILYYPNKSLELSV